MFFCKLHYLCLPQSSYNTQSFIRDTEFLKCKGERLKEGIFLPKQGNNRNRTVTFCLCAAIMHNSNCSVFTGSKIDQILMMPPFLMVVFKDLRLGTLMLHPWIGLVRNWHVPAGSTPAVTLRRHFLSPLADLEDPTGTYPLLPSSNGIGQELKRDCSAFSYCLSSCFLVISIWGQVLMTAVDCTPASVTAVLGVGPRSLLQGWQEMTWAPWMMLSGEGMQRWSQTPSNSPWLKG